MWRKSKSNFQKKLYFELFTWYFYFKKIKQIRKGESVISNSLSSTVYSGLYANEKSKCPISLIFHPVMGDGNHGSIKLKIK
jgi:hypothetical protein